MEYYDRFSEVKMDDSQWIDNILIAFDEMDFMPTTLLPDPEKARAEWKANLVAAIKEMDNHIDYLKERVELLAKQNAELKRTNEAIQGATAQDILQQMWEWKDRGTPFIADIQELADRYGVEVKNDD